MSSTWDKMDKNQIPTMEKVSDYVTNPLWNNLCQYIETQYQSKPIFEYSSCSVPG